LRRNLGELEPGVLEVGDRPAEGLSLADIIQCRAVGALHRGQRANANHHELVGQICHLLIKALPLDATEEVVGSNPHLLEEQLRGILGFAADLIEQPSDSEPSTILDLDEH
jgi:hypothetical protein